MEEDLRQAQIALLEEQLHILIESQQSHLQLFDAQHRVLIAQVELGCISLAEYETGISYLRGVRDGSLIGVQLQREDCYRKLKLLRPQKAIECSERTNLAIARTQASNCRTCINYCGQVHNGIKLVCAIHPYGSSTEICPDWENQ